MPVEARREYLKAIRVRYKNSSKKEKSLILNEFCCICKYSRKYAIAILNERVEPRQTKPGPERKYSVEFVYHLANLWRAMNGMCSKKMIAAIPVWLKYYNERTLTMAIKAQLCEVSASTIDRLLRPYKMPKKRRGLCGTRLGHIKYKIPLELLNRKITKPGYVEADTVHHCGDTLAGAYIRSLTMTDICSSWTCNRAVWTGSGENVRERIQEIEEYLPFILEGFACDNGNEFLNASLLSYFHDRKLRPVKFVRRRPYKKNDNAHVEQKNHTHVRKLFGYERLDDERLLDLMNEIYTYYWNPYHNFFVPAHKLIKKTRYGGKVRKVYDEPKTPYQRLLEHPDVPVGLKERLKVQYSWLNPFLLKKNLEKKLEKFNALLEGMKLQVSGF